MERDGGGPLQGAPPWSASVPASQWSRPAPGVTKRRRPAVSRRPMEAVKTILSVRISVDKCGLVVKNAALSLINHLSSLIDTYGTIFYRATAPRDVAVLQTWFSRVPPSPGNPLACCAVVPKGVGESARVPASQWSRPAPGVTAEARRPQRINKVPKEGKR